MYQWGLCGREIKRTDIVCIFLMFHNKNIDGQVKIYAGNNEGKISDFLKMKVIIIVYIVI